jgi:hypothetical protein
MAGQVSLLFKILCLSALGSAVIKYALPYGFGIEAIAPSHVGAMVAILLPSLVLGIFLWWQTAQMTDP